MSEIHTIENSLSVLEKALRLNISIIDNAGAFHTSQGAVVFSSMRQSHRKNPVCDIGFCKKCINHCRYAMNEKCAKCQEPFLETCWKGISEIVVPLQKDGVHFGMLYAGSWRAPESLIPDDLPKKFYAQYNKLSYLPETEEIEGLKNVLKVFATGILNILKELNAFEKVPDTRGNQIMEFIKNHAVENIELADIARHLNLSCSRTSYIIHDVLDKTFPVLIREERLRRVKTLLVSSNMTLKEVASRTGFSDEYYLSRIFKHENGQTPGQYKKTMLTLMSLKS